MSYDLSDYVDVKTRLTQALEKYPELRITEHRPVPIQVGDQMFIECAVTVARDPEDPVPVTAYMYEPFPGRTPYTKLSEQANGSTSALGRALGFMGFGITASLASANEVRNRQDQPSRVDQLEQRRETKQAATGTGTATAGQLATVRARAIERGVTVTEDELMAMTSKDASDMIATLKSVPRLKK